MMRGAAFISLLIPSVLASPITHHSQAAPLPLPNHEVVGFPVGIWIENIAVRPNGNLLLTSLSPNASLYEVSNPASKSPSITRHFTVDSVSGFLGITGTDDDVFAIVGGNSSTTTGGVKGTYGVWKVDFSDDQTQEPELVTSIPEAVLLNGATTVPHNKNLILIADSLLGLVWRVDISTGKYDVAAQVPEMENQSNSTLAITINGLHIHSGHLWWTNYYESTLYKIEVTDDGYPPPGAQAQKVVKVSDSSSAADDFIFGPEHKNVAWVATNKDNKIVAVKPDGGITVVAGASGSDEVPIATAAKFGRTAADAKTLYVSTGTGSIGGSFVGGKVQAIDTASFQ